MNLFPLPPGRNSLSCQSIFRTALLQRRSITAAAFTLFCIALSISSASAQTRARRVQSNGSEESSNRETTRKTAITNEVGKRGGNKPATDSSTLVRRTALSYPAPAATQSTKRPVLVNDIAVVSSVGKESTVKVVSPTTPRAGAAAANIPSIWPVSGPLSSGFGVRGNPFGGPGSEFHKGQDISVPLGTPVVATADGTVVIAGWLRGYGWVVYIDHGNGISTRYGHLSRIDVAVGQSIRRGEQLGLSGSTGRSTGPHVHYEVRINGQAVNPLQYLPPIVISKAPGEEEKSAKR